MDFGKNGARAKVLGQRPPYGPDEVALLHAERLKVLLGLTTTDAERRTIEGELLGWEERPHLSVLIDRLERRAVDPDDRSILKRSSGLRILLPAALPEPAPDPVLEQLIVECAVKKVQAQAVADAALDKLVDVRLELRRTAKPEELERLKEKERAAAEERADAVLRQERIQSRLGYLLQQRNERLRSFSIAEHTKQ